MQVLVSGTCFCPISKEISNSIIFNQLNHLGFYGFQNESMQMSTLQMDPLNPYEALLTWVGPGAQLHLALGSIRASACCGMNPNLVNCICKAITAVRTNVANLSDAAMWKIKRARFARNRQKSVRSLRDSVKGPVESKRALSLPETLTTKIRWVSIYIFVTRLYLLP